jgi:mannose/cellobiose epimerase-like protein (N-acyl-D-glucosamine 2-epimerase family)
MHDDEHGGWIEHLAADFSPLASDTAFVGIPRVGFKGANSHLHWMEALNEFADVTGDPDARSALEEALRVNVTFFFPEDAVRARVYRGRDWSPARDPRGDVHSYGHTVEFAWLMLRAHEVLGTPPPWDHFDALVRHAITWGFDAEHGGFYDLGPYQGPATQRDRIWWAQAEGLVALTHAVRHRADPAYEGALDRHLGWILERQRLPSGLWAPRVEPTGRGKSIFAPGAWKGGYHEVRAMAKFVEAFARAPI